MRETVFERGIGDPLLTELKLLIINRDSSIVVSCRCFTF